MYSHFTVVRCLFFRFSFAFLRKLFCAPSLNWAVRSTPMTWFVITFIHTNAWTHVPITASSFLPFPFSSVERHSALPFHHLFSALNVNVRSPLNGERMRIYKIRWECMWMTRCMKSRREEMKKK